MGSRVAPTKWVCLSKKSRSLFVYLVSLKMQSFSGSFHEWRMHHLAREVVFGTYVIYLSGQADSDNGALRVQEVIVVFTDSMSSHPRAPLRSAKLPVPKASVNEYEVKKTALRDRGAMFLLPGRMSWPS